MVDNIEYTINHGLSYETANYLQNMGDGRLMPVPVRAIALDFPRFAIMHDHAATGDRIEYNGLEYQIVGPVRRHLGWAIFQVKQAMARGAAWVPNFTPGAPRARDIVQRVGGVVLLDAPGNSIGPGVTFSRDDQAMVCDESGNWTWTALPYRRSYDAQTKEWGYLFESQRTNLAFRTLQCSDTDASSSDVTVGTLTGKRFVTSLGGWVGYGYNPIAVTAGAQYTASAFVVYEKVPTRVSVTVTGDFMDVAGTQIREYYTSKVIPGKPVRVSCTFTAHSSGQVMVWFAHHDGNPGSVTVYGCQLETGPIATSPIATNGAAKTVAADVCTLPTSSIAEVLIKVNDVATCAPATAVTIPAGSKVQFLATFPTQLDAATRQLMLSVVQ